VGIAGNVSIIYLEVVSQDFHALIEDHYPELPAPITKKLPCADTGVAKFLSQV
jgi:hypothetical protein